MAKKYRTPTSQVYHKHVDTNVNRKTQQAIDSCIFLTPALEEQIMPSISFVRPIVSTGPVEDMTEDEMFDNLESLLDEMENRE